MTIEVPIEVGERQLAADRALARANALIERTNAERLTDGLPPLPLLTLSELLVERLVERLDGWVAEMVDSDFIKPLLVVAKSLPPEKRATMLTACEPTPPNEPALVDAEPKPPIVTK